MTVRQVRDTDRIVSIYVATPMVAKASTVTSPAVVVSGFANKCRQSKVSFTLARFRGRFGTKLARLVMKTMLNAKSCAKIANVNAP